MYRRNYYRHEFPLHNYNVIDLDLRNYNLPSYVVLQQYYDELSKANIAFEEAKYTTEDEIKLIAEILREKTRV